MKKSLAILNSRPNAVVALSADTAQYVPSPWTPPSGFVSNEAGDKKSHGVLHVDVHRHTTDLQQQKRLSAASRLYRQHEWLR